MSTTDDQRLRDLLKEIHEPIRLAAQSCRARAFDQMDNSNSQKFWQQHSDDLDAVIDKIYAAKALTPAFDHTHSDSWRYEAKSEVGEPAAPVDARDANVAALQECIAYAETGSMRGKPVGWHRDMIRAATKALAALARQAAAPASSNLGKTS